MSAIEDRIVLLLRGRWLSGVPAAPGPEPVPAHMLNALRAERGKAQGEPVAVPVPHRKGVVFVTVVEDRP